MFASHFEIKASIPSFVRSFLCNLFVFFEHMMVCMEVACSYFFAWSVNSIEEGTSWKNLDGWHYRRLLNNFDKEEKE